MSEEFEYSLTEFCKLTRLDTNQVRELVAEGIIEPHVERDYWYFSSSEVGQCVRANRLMKDLDLNLHGAALALELMERNRHLRRKVAYLERLLQRLQEQA